MSDSLKSKLLPTKLFYDTYQLDSYTANKLFNAWYEEHIEPLFANAIEVTGYYDTDDEALYYGSRPSQPDTHKALLFGVTPIERGVTVDEIVKAMKLALHLDDYGSVDDPKPNQVLRECLDRVSREGVKP